MVYGSLAAIGQAFGHGNYYGYGIAYFYFFEVYGFFPKQYGAKLVVQEIVGSDAQLAQLEHTGLGSKIGIGTVAHVHVAINLCPHNGGGKMLHGED